MRTRSSGVDINKGQGLKGRDTMSKAEMKHPSTVGLRLTEKPLVSAAGQTIFDRADEYVCSEALTGRLISEKVLAA